MNKKTEKKKQEKVIEDRTFGLKNKNKSKAVQKFIKGVETTVKHQGVPMSKLESEEFEKRKLRKKQEQEEALLNSLYRDVNKLKCDDSDEENPANIVCPYFKQGLCQKGKKCLYSHDLTMDRNEEIDLYVDQRTQLIMNAIGGKQLGELSEEELGKMIGEKERQIIKGCKSDIVCKFFLEAAEKEKYGWNWSCPNNGDRCKYKHCLPPGYKLKRDGGKADVEIEKVDIQKKIDDERNKLLSENRGSPLVTYQVFLKWKEDRKKRKQLDAKKKKDDDEKKNKQKMQLKTGKELFDYDRTLFVDDEEAAVEYEKEEIIEEEEEQQKQEHLYGEDDQEEEELEKEEAVRVEEKEEEV